MLSVLLASLAIVMAPCPNPAAHSGEVAGCYSDSTSTVYIAPNQNASTRRTVLGHELGHTFDMRHLDDSERATVIGLLHWSRWMPERFADEFSACYVPNRVREKARYSGIYTPRFSAPWLCHRLPDFL